MIDITKTRIILDGKILSHVKRAEIILDADRPVQKVILHIFNCDTLLCDTRTAVLLGIDTVLENHTKKEEDTVTWTQFICQSEDS